MHCTPLWKKVYYVCHQDKFLTRNNFLCTFVMCPFQTVLFGIRQVLPSPRSPSVGSVPVSGMDAASLQSDLCSSGGGLR